MRIDDERDPRWLDHDRDERDSAIRDQMTEEERAEQCLAYCAMLDAVLDDEDVFQMVEADEEGKRRWQQGRGW